MSEIKTKKELLLDIRNTTASRVELVEIDIEHLEKFAIPELEKKMSENKEGGDKKKELKNEIKRFKDLIKDYQEQLSVSAELLTIMDRKIKE